MEIGYSLTHHPLVIKKDIPNLDQFWRREIRDTVRAKLLTQPDLFGKPLRRSLKGCRTLRVGNYRVVFQIKKENVHIVAIIDRSTDYRGVEARL
ncbi:MAG TPA: type II toxin-antitoxin system RelE/ParE family toxin [Candidatus Paceibacterota bacterium]